LGAAGAPIVAFSFGWTVSPGLRNYLKTVCFADNHGWTLCKGAADGQNETGREAVAHDLAGIR
jgi:hypothetical protein